jgi:hypothetical protein
MIDVRPQMRDKPKLVLKNSARKSSPRRAGINGVQSIADEEDLSHDRIRNCRNRAQDDLPSPRTEGQIDRVSGDRRPYPARVRVRQRGTYMP